MGGFATAELAIAVSKSGGLGQIGSDGSMKNLEVELSKVEKALDRTEKGLLPIGVGLLSFVTERGSALQIVEKYKPAVVWLFAAHKLSDYAEWAKEVRKVTSHSQIWVQIGSVAGALEIAKDTRPDVICVQGIDAGGHGWEKGAGIISLLPEVSDALAGTDIALVAAGGGSRRTKRCCCLHAGSARRRSRDKVHCRIGNEDQSALSGCNSGCTGWWPDDRSCKGL